jgi:hypothetical protein
MKEPGREGKGVGGSVRLTLFSVEEANRVVAEVGPAVQRLVQMKRELDRTQRRIDVLTVALSGAAPSNPDAIELQGLQERRSVIGNDITRGVRDVQRRGCLLKDLDRGLLDFYAISGDRLIFLCWQVGEGEIAHWHTLEGGFAARQPLSSSDLD